LITIIVYVLTYVNDEVANFQQAFSVSSGVILALAMTRLEVFCIGCIDFAVLAIWLALKIVFVLAVKAGWTWAENL